MSGNLIIFHKSLVLLETLHVYGYLICERECPCSVMIKELDCGIVVSEIEIQSRYIIHFWSNTFGERHEPSYPPSYGLNSTTAVLLGRWI